MRSLLTKLFGVLFSTFFLHVSVDAADKIRIAIPGTGPFLTFSLAQKKGFFKDEGLDAEIIQIRCSSVAMAAAGFLAVRILRELWRSLKRLPNNRVEPVEK